MVEIPTFLDKGKELFFEEGEVIFEEGEVLSGVYFIKEGVCKLTKLSTSGKIQIVRFVKNGDILGKRSIVSEEPVNLTAVALKKMKVIFIPKNEVFFLLESNMEFSLEIIKDFCKELRHSDNLMVDMALKSVKQRIANAILLFNETFGNDSEGYIDLLLSREEMSNLVGGATETVIRTLSEFVKMGMVETQTKRIKILDEVRLKKIVQGEY